VQNIFSYFNTVAKVLFIRKYCLFMITVAPNLSRPSGSVKNQFEFAVTSSTMKSEDLNFAVLRQLRRQHSRCNA
jgi:hypothetical protein